jgi:methionyl-tRNA formyltransferase
MSARVVFMGSPQFAVPSLNALVEAGHDVTLAITQPDRPSGRGGKFQSPPVRHAAEVHGIPIFQPDTMRDEAVHNLLREAHADLFVVAAYGRILPQAVLDIPAHGVLNVHASLLPRWRGPSPIVAAIREGDRNTGVSIMKLVRKMDAGPVLSTVTLPIEPGDTAGTLEPRLAEAGAQELVRVLPRWLAGTIEPAPQDEAAVTYCSILTKQDGWLKTEMSAAEAERAVRAYDPWPGAFVMDGASRLSIWKARVQPDGHGRVAGSVALIEKLPAVAFRDGWLVLEELQKPGGKRVTGQQYLAGQRGLLPESVTLA